MSVLRTWIRRPITWIALGVVVVAAGAIGLALFQPWKLVVDDTVDEAAPAVADVAPSSSASPTAASRVLATGEFITHEHETSGKAVVFQLPDGKRVLRLENLNTSNGPDLHVWITDAPVKPGASGWRSSTTASTPRSASSRGTRAARTTRCRPASISTSSAA